MMTEITITARREMIPPRNALFLAMALCWFGFAMTIADSELSQIILISGATIFLSLGLYLKEPTDGD